MNLYQSLRDYEEFIYTLPQQFASIAHSTLVVVRRGARMVTVSGEIIFPESYRLVVKERLTSDAGPLVLTRYGYEVWRGGEKLYWYDSQPHPNDPTLAATTPHHKHIPPQHQVPPHPRARTLLHAPQPARANRGGGAVVEGLNACVSHAGISSW